MVDSKDFSSYIEVLSKASLALLAFIYAMGVFVVSLHQSRYGLASISLVRTQYVLAGIWVLAPLMGVLIIGSWMGSAWHDIFRQRPPGGQSRAKRWLWRGRAVLQAVGWAIVCLMFALFVFDVGASYITGREWAMTLPKMLGVMGSLLGFALLIGFTLVGSWVFLRDVNLAAPGKTANDLLWGVSYVSVTVILVIAYVSYFTFNWYEKIPGSIGGGAPIPVQFILAPVAAPDTAVLILEQGGKKSVTYRLLLSTETSYIVTDPFRKNEAIEIDRGAVKAVVYLPD